MSCRRHQRKRAAFELDPRPQGGSLFKGPLRAGFVVWWCRACGAIGRQPIHRGDNVTRRFRRITWTLTQRRQP